jgi:hypothetical protein
MLNSDINTDNIRQKITDELETVLVRLLTNKKDAIIMLDGIRTIKGWYQQAKKDSTEIPSIIVNEAIRKLLEHVVPELSKYLIENVEVKLEINPYSFRFKGKIKIDFAVKPFVEFIQTIDGVESPLNKVTLTFRFAVSGYLEDIGINRSIVGLQINIARFAASLTVSIIEVTHSTLHLPPIDPPLILCSKEFFKVENFSFYLSKY